MIKANLLKVENRCARFSFWDLLVHVSYGVTKYENSSRARFFSDLWRCSDHELVQLDLFKNFVHRD